MSAQSKDNEVDTNDEVISDAHPRTEIPVRSSRSHSSHAHSVGVGILFGNRCLDDATVIVANDGSPRSRKDQRTTNLDKPSSWEDQHEDEPDGVTTVLCQPGISVTTVFLRPPLKWLFILFGLAMFFAYNLIGGLQR